ncbi:DUF2642 domain-containing protein [Peribacillus alkalitolerans]|uniref:DUF2642 domain-containing protein n=1 Tax=Peribacillus alkalitolerans TaxID=1550385 RepID=UPI0013D7E056|nr:DUF2642 domain-containing protein [Peribacillus alkalitolerans]
MSNINTLMGQQVCILLSGKTTFKGVLIDLGQDILVLYNGQQFIYIPMLHVHRIQLVKDKNEFVSSPTESEIPDDMDAISYRKILTNAKGTFAEIYVTGNLTFHGYITSVLNDYFVFYSPVYKTMFISMSHLKWLTPYNQTVTPYSLSNESLPVHPTSVPIQRSLEEQLKREVGKLVVFDAGSDPMKIGKLISVNNNLVELAIANGDTVFLKLSHIKSVHMT